MKSKFGLGLSQLIAPRFDERHGHGIAGSMAMSPDGSPPPSPYPGRRAPLPTRTEAELRAACLSMLTNQMPSHLAAAPAPLESPKAAPVKAQLDYAAIKKSIDRPADVDVQRPNRRATRTIDPESSEMAELQAAVDSSKYAYKPSTSIADLFAHADRTTDPTQLNRANTVRRRDDVLAAGPPHRRTKSGQPSQTQPMKFPASTTVPQDRPKASRRTASQETSDSTPQTDGTDYLWSTSTAPTSAGVTPARNSKRASAHLQLEQDTNVKADATPIEWMRSELDKRRKQHTATRSRRPSEHERPEPRAGSRAPSRARSIRSLKSVRSIKSLTASMTDNIKEYIRPGSSRAHSRSASRSASQTRQKNTRTTSFDQDRQDRGPVTRPPPRRDWRNWGRSRKEDGNGTSSGDVSRSNSVRGRTENRKGTTSKAEIDLNRELPPLPGLDQWDQQVPHRPAHIVNMRSPPSHSRPTYSPLDRAGQPPTYLVKSPAVNEKDEIVATRLGTPVRTKPEVYQPTRANKQAASGTKSTAHHATGVARTTDTDREVRDGEIRIEFSLEDLMPSYSGSTNSDRPQDTGPRLRAEAPSAHSRTASSFSHNRSMKSSRSLTPLEVSKSTPSLPTAAPSFSRHRKYETSDIPPALNSNVANQGRKVANKADTDTIDPRYRRETEIPATKTSRTPVPQSEEKKAWWQLKSKQKKQMTWMDQLERLGIKDGVLVNNEVAGSPIVRY